MKLENLCWAIITSDDETDDTSPTQVLNLNGCIQNVNNIMQNASKHVCHWIGAPSHLHYITLVNI